MLGAIDLERGAKVCGSRFYFLTGVGAQLEFALINMAMDQARDTGFTQVIAPSLVKPRAMEGTGFLGQAADDVYRIEGEDLYLVGTSEVPMAAYHSDEILDAGALPLRYAAFSPCFRKEAGSHGKDTRGIFRVHWFDKVEMFVYTTLEESYAEHQRLLEWEKEFLDKLELCLPRDRRRRRRPRARRAAQVRLRGVDPDARASTASSPRPPTAPTSRRVASTSAAASRAARAGRDAQRHAVLDQPRRSSRSSRPTSRRTGRSRCRRRCSPTSAGSRCSSRSWREPQLSAGSRPGGRSWSRSTSTAPCSSGSRAPARPTSRSAGRCTTRCTARSTPARTSCSPAGARRTA